MFTGLVQAVGEVRGIEKRANGARLAIDAGKWAYARSARVGDSVSVAGVCLTIVRVAGGRTDRSKPRSVARRSGFEFDVVRETLDKTRLGALRAGDRVNLEHAATMGALLGGHLVQGHVDGVGRVLKVRRGGDWRVWIGAPRGLEGYLVSKGSVCVEGVSLTVAGVTGREFSVALIPETLAKTTLGELREGDAVNLEMDVIAKMVAGMLAKRKAKTEKRKVRRRRA